MKRFGFLLPLLLASSCDIFYTIPINGQSEGLKLSLDCGTMDVQMLNWQGHAFDFYQQCDFNEPVTLFADSITAIWKNKTFPLSFIAEGNDNRKLLTVKGKKEVRTAFYINEMVQQGDTIIVIPKGYLYCNNQRVHLDTLKLFVKQDLKSPTERLFGKKKSE